MQNVSAVEIHLEFLGAAREFCVVSNSNTDVNHAERERGLI